MSCATILASALDFPETALRYPSYATVLSEMLEASMARLTATEELVRYSVRLQHLQLTFVESGEFVADHPSSFEVVDLLSRLAGGFGLLENLRQTLGCWGRCSLDELVVGHVDGRRYKLSGLRIGPSDEEHGAFQQIQLEPSCDEAGDVC